MHHDTIFIDCCLRPAGGSFARFKKVNNGRHLISHWYFCREIFHGIMRNLTLFFFSHNKFQCDNIISFMTKLEDKLGVHPKSEYGPTQRKTIMWIKPSSWWMRLSMRRSIFTIFLRAAMNYDRKSDNFIEAMKSEKYLSKTWYATKRFISGFTRYTGKKTGWYKQFRQAEPSKSDVKALLVKPKN